MVVTFIIENSFNESTAGADASGFMPVNTPLPRLHARPSSFGPAGQRITPDDFANPRPQTHQLKAGEGNIGHCLYSYIIAIL